jgi:cystathionine beta-lyase family protein involved in aluminum resistance
MAPHTVAQALKTAVFCAAMLDELGYESYPGPQEQRSDIIQTICLGSADNLVKFCQGIQKGSPVDSFVAPVPWQMPGYDCPVVMAAGAFIQGSTMELSADGPIRDPYAVYFQGGLTWNHAKLGIMMSLQKMVDAGLVTL